jgi:hypothetical protein
MKLVILSVFIHVIASLLFAVYGEYYDSERYVEEYWAIIYYIPLYFMLCSVMRYLAISAITKLRRWLFWVMFYYYILLIASNVICLVKIDLYDDVIGYVDYWGLSPVLIVLVAIFLNAVRIKVKNRFKVKRHDPKD